ncbi:MAG: hypothetical protein MMC23_007539 [Stictis urceolatum]|nr:hypothetical protein [Stictis urceolata]
MSMAKLDAIPEATAPPNPYGSEELTFQAIYCTFLCFAALQLQPSKSCYDYSDDLEWDQLLYPSTKQPWKLGCLDTFIAMLAPGPHELFPNDQRINLWLKNHQNFEIHGRTLNAWAEWFLSTNKDIDREVDDEFARDRLCTMIGWGMRLMVTTTGHVGWADSRWREGDQLYLLYGSSVPVVLRPRSRGGFSIVGDAFIAGFMDGEAAQDGACGNWMDVEIH